MATLFGTTADGESLPVQVNEFGQLVAQGLAGPQGEQGEQGPVGPPGNTPFTWGTFTPEFRSDDPDGQAFYTYANRSGEWYRLGSLLTVSVYLLCTDVAVTGPRGNLCVAGLPSEADFAVITYAGYYGPSSVNRLRLSANWEPDKSFATYHSPISGFRLSAEQEGGVSPIPFYKLDQEGDGTCEVAMWWSGLAGDSVRSVSGSLDDLM